MIFGQFVCRCYERHGCGQDECGEVLTVDGLPVRNGRPSTTATDQEMIFELQ